MAARDQAKRSVPSDLGPWWIVAQAIWCQARAGPMPVRGLRDRRQGRITPSPSARRPARPTSCRRRCPCSRPCRGGSSPAAATPAVLRRAWLEHGRAAGDPVICPEWIYHNCNMVERLRARSKEWRAIATPTRDCRVLYKRPLPRPRHRLAQALMDPSIGGPKCFSHNTSCMSPISYSSFSTVCGTSCRSVFSPCADH